MCFSSFKSKYHTDHSFSFAFTVRTSDRIFLIWAVSVSAALNQTELLLLPTSLPERGFWINLSLHLLCSVSGREEARRGVGGG